MQQWKDKKHKQKYTSMVIERIKLLIDDRKKTDRTDVTNGAVLVDAMIEFNKNMTPIRY